MGDRQKVQTYDRDTVDRWDTYRACRGTNGGTDRGIYRGTGMGGRRETDEGAGTSEESI